MRTKKKADENREKIGGVGRGLRSTSKLLKTAKDGGIKWKRCSVVLERMPASLTKPQPLKLVDVGDEDAKNESVYEFDESSGEVIQQSETMDDLFKELKRQNKIEIKKHKRIGQQNGNVERKKEKPAKRKAIASAPASRNKKVKKTNLEIDDAENMKPAEFKSPIPLKKAVVLVKRLSEQELSPPPKASPDKGSKETAENARKANTSSGEGNSSAKRLDIPQSPALKVNVNLRRLPQRTGLAFQSTPKPNALNASKATAIFNNASPLADITNLTIKSSQRQRLNVSHTVALPDENIPLLDDIFADENHNNKENSNSKKSPRRSSMVQLSPARSDAEFSIFDLDASDAVANHASIFAPNRSAASNRTAKSPEKKVRSYERTPMKNIVS